MPDPLVALLARQVADLNTRFCCWACNPSFTLMGLCRQCGNKRCPHATNHTLACTRSNAPGQPGSIYEEAPPQTGDERSSRVGDSDKKAGAKMEGGE